MISHIRGALVMLILFTLITGVAYPLVTTGIAQVIFPGAANGSVISYFVASADAGAVDVARNNAAGSGDSRVAWSGADRRQT